MVWEVWRVRRESRGSAGRHGICHNFGTSSLRHQSSYVLLSCHSGGTNRKTLEFIINTVSVRHAAGYVR